LTLTPMLCSRMLKEHVQEGRVGSAAQRGFEALDRFYDRLVRGALGRRRLVVVATVVILGAIALLYRGLPSELVPTEDRGTVLGIVVAPEGSTLAYTDRYLRQIEDMFRKTPEVEKVFSAIGLAQAGPGRVTDGILFAALKPPGDRKRTQQEIVAGLFPQMLGVPGVLAFPINLPSLGGGFSLTPVQYVLQAPTYDELRPAVATMLAEAGKLGYLLNLDTDLKLNTPQVELTIDRARASGLGVSVADIGTTLQTLLGGREVTQFRRGDKQYKVLLQMRPEDRATPRAIEGLYLRGSEGLFQMANVVVPKETVAAKELNHFNRIRAARITANLTPGVTLGQALDDLDAIAKEKLPSGIRRDLDGESRDFREASGTLYFLFGFAIVFIYLVLAAQFESFVHPLTILLTVPLAVFGALATLFLFGMTLNIYSQIGLILLIGLVTKNAILIVEYANQLREKEGLETREAAARAARIRLRPILMTSLATVFGVLPIALGLGAGAQSRKPLGAAVVGGLLFSTVLTLVVVPVVYSLLSGRREAAKPAEEGEPLMAAGGAAG